MKSLFLTVVSLVSLNLHSQYYYNDIISTGEINNKMKTFLAARVQSVTAAGYDARGTKTTDFNEWQDVQANGTVLKITTRNGQNVSRVYYQFDDKTRVINARDSSTEIQTITHYTYDAGGNLTRIKTSFLDSLNEFNQTEERQWQYTASGKPEIMRRILNEKDTVEEFRFTVDEHGNVADETPYRKVGTNDPVIFMYEIRRIYYYYDDRNRLTDIVKYDKNLMKLLPDFLFEYDDNNRVIQKTTIVSITKRDYFKWRYGFNNKGLKTREVLYNKFDEAKGRIDYSYTFTP